MEDFKITLLQVIRVIAGAIIQVQDKNGFQMEKDQDTQLWSAFNDGEVVYTDTEFYNSEVLEIRPAQCKVYIKVNLE